ncbi:type III secretion chaperone SycN [Pantoea cypripedii]|uniref:type III secretion chaperone SycN n=1 Tax=Pantoea cypripedii TaxID=55209 RepID=UPI002FC9CEF2
MELQTERRLEQFLQLAELPTSQISSRMEFVMQPFRLYIECLDRHILLTLGQEVEPSYQTQILRKSLKACHPARTQGSPVRAWQLRGQQMLSCSPLKESGVNHWLACLNSLRRLLEMLNGGQR